MKKEINNETLESVNGGATPITNGFQNVLCEGTVASKFPGQTTCNGISFTSIVVHGDDGKEYNCIWSARINPTQGMRVRITQNTMGVFRGYCTADPI